MPRPFLKVRNILDKILDEIKTYFMFSNFFSKKKNHVVYEIMWKNMVKPDRRQEYHSGHALFVLDK